MKIFLYLNNFCLDSTNLLSNNTLIYNEIVNINNCIFTRTFLYNNGNGGIIYLENINYNMIINNTIFYSIKCSKMGGSIYYRCLTTNTGFIFNKLCIIENSCGLNEWGQFAYITSSGIIQNNFNLSTILKSSNQYSGKTTLFIQSNYQNIFSLNFSFNFCQSQSSLVSYDPTKLLSNFNIFFNNSVNSDTCFNIVGGANDGIITFNNFILNNSPLFNGIILLSGSGKNYFKNCLFSNNFDILFSIQYWNSLYLENCKINHLSLSNLYSGNFNTNSNNSILFTLESLNLFDFTYFSTIYCFNILKINTLTKKFNFNLNILIIFLI